MTAPHSSPTPKGTGSASISNNTRQGADACARDNATGPSAIRGLAAVAALAVGLWALGSRVDDGYDDSVGKLGRLEVTARLVERPEQFPSLGAYRYTYVLQYKVLKVHRSDPQRKHRVVAGDDIFVGHYKPWVPRGQIRDNDWGDSPLGGRLDQFIAGTAHRMALDYELQDFAPSGVLDYCFPPEGRRFFALWTNPTTY